VKQDRAIFKSLDRSAIGEWIYTIFCQRLQSGWLVGHDLRAIVALADRQLAKFTGDRPHFISISTPDPLEFIATLMAGCRLGLPIFLGNPGWGKLELEQVARLTARVDTQHHNLIMVPTGGSSGRIEFAMHTWQTLSASVWGFQEFYQVEKINTVCTLPLYHVSGLMQLCRSLLTDGELYIIDFHDLCNGTMLPIDLKHYFISLVPTQLSKLLDLNRDWLRQFQTILLGGAPPSSELLTRARINHLPLALTYGMTETASQVTSLKPAEFLAGNNSCGVALPHARIELISSADEIPDAPAAHQIDSIRIYAESLMLGYFPDLHPQPDFEPDDLGALDKFGYLTILGRNSHKIITGGENVFPIEVVDAIMATGLVADVWVVGVPDRYWGQVVVAIYVEGNLPVSVKILSQAIASKISKYKVPKLWIAVDRIPRNSLGKVLNLEVEKLICKNICKFS
jgi:o-succinylbenzoate---CoA ligase